MFTPHFLIFSSLYSKTAPHTALQALALFVMCLATSKLFVNLSMVAFSSVMVVGWLFLISAMAISQNQ